jgi:hypothetical protein
VDRLGWIGVIRSMTVPRLSYRKNSCPEVKPNAKTVTRKIAQIKKMHLMLPLLRGRCKGLVYMYKSVSKRYKLNCRYE